MSSPRTVLVDPPPYYESPPPAEVKRRSPQVANTTADLSIDVDPVYPVYPVQPSGQRSGVTMEEGRGGNDRFYGDSGGFCNLWVKLGSCLGVFLFVVVLLIAIIVDSVHIVDEGKVGIYFTQVSKVKELVSDDKDYQGFSFTLRARWRTSTRTLVSIGRRRS